MRILPLKRNFDNTQDGSIPRQTVRAQGQELGANGQPWLCHGTKT